MGLDDIKDVNNNSTLYWYKNASGNMSDYAETTKVDFGEGRNNTIAIKAKCALSSGSTGYYGAVDSRDMWAYIPTLPKAGANPTLAANDTVENRWFIPSRGEWAAFGDAFKITKTSGDVTYYGNFGLSNCYWSSSQRNAYNAWRANFGNGYFGNIAVNGDFCVRASATF